MRRKLLNVLSAYAPQVECLEKVNEKFRNEPKEEIRDVPIIWYFGRMRREAERYEGMPGGHGYRIRNEERDRMIEFAEWRIDIYQHIV